MTLHYRHFLLPKISISFSTSTMNLQLITCIQATMTFNHNSTQAPILSVYDIPIDDDTATSTPPPTVYNQLPPLNTNFNNTSNYSPNGGYYPHPQYPSPTSLHSSNFASPSPTYTTSQQSSTSANSSHIPAFTTSPQNSFGTPQQSPTSATSLQNPNYTTFGNVSPNFSHRPPPVFGNNSPSNSNNVNNSTNSPNNSNTNNNVNNNVYNNPNYNNASHDDSADKPAVLPRLSWNILVRGTLPFPLISYLLPYYPSSLLALLPVSYCL